LHATAAPQLRIDFFLGKRRSEGRDCRALRQIDLFNLFCLAWKEAELYALVGV